MPAIRAARVAKVAKVARVSGAAKAAERVGGKSAPGKKFGCGSGHGGFKPGNVCGKGKRAALAEKIKAARTKAKAGEIDHAELRTHVRELRHHRRGQVGAIGHDAARERLASLKAHHAEVVKDAADNTGAHANRVAAAMNYKPKEAPRPPLAPVPDLARPARGVPSWKMGRDDQVRSANRDTRARFIKGQRRDAQANVNMVDRAGEHAAIRDTVRALNLHAKGHPHAVDDHTAHVLHQTLSSSYRPHAVKDVHHLDVATAEIKAAHSLQRARNAGDAAAQPVHEKQGPTHWSVDHYKFNHDEAVVAKARDEADYAVKSKQLADEIKNREKLTRKTIDYKLSRKTRDKHEKALESTSDAHYALRREVNEIKYRLEGFHDHQIEYFKDLHARAVEEHGDGTIKVHHAALVKDHPDLIAPGHIADRIRKYKVGDAKVHQLRKLEDRHDSEDHALIQEQTPHWKATREHRLKLDEINSRPGAGPDDGHQAEREAIHAEIARHQPQIDAIQIRRDALKVKHRGEVEHILAVDRPMKFHGTDVEPGFTNSKGRELHPLEGKAAASRDEAHRWLEKVVARSDHDTIETKLGANHGMRAHQNDNNNYIQVDHKEGPDVVVHEYGHKLESSMKTGPEHHLARAVEFLKHRVGDEPAIDMHEKFSNGDPGEMGRKDRFDEVFGQYSAHYTGKDYSIGNRPYATEISSMGMQQMYEDPKLLARRDPEFAKFILGTMDGSLR